jgi:hypothetical protein
VGFPFSSRQTPGNAGATGLVYFVTSKRLPLSGGLRIFWDDGGEDAVGGLLDVFEALRKEFGVSSIQTDVVHAAGSGLQANRVANNKSDGLGFGLADSLRSFPGALKNASGRVPSHAPA